MTKPYTTDSINYTLHGCTVQFLTADDTIMPGDFVRELYEHPMMSESGGWDTTYKNDKWRGTFWHKASYEMPGWVGRTYMEYLEFVYDGRVSRTHGGGPPLTQVPYEHEIVRVINLKD